MGVLQGWINEQACSLCYHNLAKETSKHQCYAYKTGQNPVKPCHLIAPGTWIATQCLCTNPILDDMTVFLNVPLKKYGLLCMFYYRCKYVLDFYIVFFLSMLSQAVVFNKIFNLPYKQLVFICLVVFFSSSNITCRPNINRVSFC